MNLSDIINEDEFKRRYVLWQLRNSIMPVLPLGSTVDDYVETLPMPDIEYTYYKSIADENGDLITALKSSFHLDSWQTRNHKYPVDFVFYLILKTLADSPEVEPFPMGYIIVEE